MREVPWAVLVGWHDGYAVRIVVCQHVDWWRWIIWEFEVRNEAQECAGGNVRIALCLVEKLWASESKWLDCLRTVTMTPFPTCDMLWRLLDANVRKVDWTWSVVEVWCCDRATSFSTTRIQQTLGIAMSCTSVVSATNSAYYNQRWFLMTSGIEEHYYYVMTLVVDGAVWIHQCVVTYNKAFRSSGLKYTVKSARGL